MNKGIITTYTLVFGGIFLLSLGGLLTLIITQNRVSLQRVGFQEALHAAEAGLEYYKWRLNHFPSDLQDGTGQLGPYEHEYQDNTGKVTGSFSLDIQGTTQCGEVLGATITSTGWTNQFPNVQRTVRASYVRPSVAEFAFLLNDNVWAGADRQIKGPYHSNGGVRMDGENTSLVTSATTTWTCTESFGCDPSQEQPGVFTTANGNEELFLFPVTPFDFEGITQDLAGMKERTKNQGQGVYIGPSGFGNGYRIVVNQHTIDVHEVVDVDQVLAYNSEQGWHWEDSVIGGTQFLASYAIPQDCGLVFVEDTLWVEGQVQGKITIVAADLIDPGAEANIWLPGDITYSTTDGSDGLVLLSQHNVLISLDSPEDMKLQGVLVAQTGRFGRNHYDCGWYPADCAKSTLETFGAIVSNERVGTKWTYSWGGFASGYQDREAIFDPKQTISPSPFLPTTSQEFELKSWEEVEQ